MQQRMSMELEMVEGDFCHLTVIATFEQPQVVTSGQR